MLIHGGFWGPRFGADILDKVAADLAERGWTTWNVEYRRLGIGGGYPSTLQDVAAAIDHLGTLLTSTPDAWSPLVTVLAATWQPGPRAGPSCLSGAPGARQVIEIAGVLSLAGVLDLGAAARQMIGHGAAFELMGGGPADVPDRYAIADPLAQVPIPAAVRCVHARADDRVPFEESATYVIAASAAGQDARLIEVDGDHFSVADPSAPTWPVVVTELEQLLARKVSLAVLPWPPRTMCVGRYWCDAASFWST